MTPDGRNDVIGIGNVWLLMKAEFYVVVVTRPLVNMVMRFWVEGKEFDYLSDFSFSRTVLLLGVMFYTHR